jgi:PAS domain-containing protein
MELFFGSLHQEDKEKVIAESLKSRVLNEYWEIEYRISTPSGKLKYVRTHTKVLGGVARDEQVFVGSCIDITETRNFEIELRYKEQSLLLSQDIAKLGTWYLDLEKNEIHWTSGV